MPFAAIWMDLEINILSEISQIPWYHLYVESKKIIYIYVCVCYTRETNNDTVNQLCRCSVAKSFLTPCNPMNCSMPGFPVLCCLPGFAQTPLSQWCHLTILHSVAPFSACPHSFTASGTFPANWLFAWGGQSIGASASASDEYSELISIRTDWFDLLEVQRTLKSLLQHHRLKSSTVQHSAFFMICPTLISTHDYWKNHSFWLHIPLSVKWSFCFLTCCVGLS